MLYINKVSQLHAFVGGDAPISSTDRGVTDAIAPESLPRPDKPNNDRKRKASKPPQPTKPAIIPDGPSDRSTKSADGLFTANRKGTPICLAWQSGGCGMSVSGGLCPADRTRSHQCNRCLSNAHAGRDCNKGGNRKGGGRGNGGGKGGGKGKGKRLQW